MMLEIGRYRWISKFKASSVHIVNSRTAERPWVKNKQTTNKHTQRKNKNSGSLPSPGGWNLTFLFTSERWN